MGSNVDPDLAAAIAASLAAGREDEEKALERTLALSRRATTSTGGPGCEQAPIELSDDDVGGATEEEEEEEAAAAAAAKVAPNRKGKAPSAPAAKVQKGYTPTDAPTDLSLVNILKCFGQVFTFFGDDSHPDPFAVNHCSFDFGHAERESQFLDHVTLNIGTGAVDFLTSLEGMKDPHAQDELLASYARAVVGARLQYGDVNLRDGESRGQPVGVHFLPLLVHVETERVAKEWLRAFDAAGIADVESCGVGGCVENDNECRVIKDYLAQPIIKDYLGKLSSFADYVRVREQRQAERNEHAESDDDSSIKAGGEGGMASSDEEGNAEAKAEKDEEVPDGWEVVETVLYQPGTGPSEF